MTNGPMDYFKQLEQIGEQIRQVFGNNDFMKNMMPNFSDQMAQPMFGSYAPPFGTQGGGGGAPWPRVDIHQSHRELIVVAEIPGITSSADVQVAVEPERVILKGSIHARYAHVPKENVFLSERFQGPFERDIRLPVRVVPRQVKAHYQNGILELRMLKEDPSSDGSTAYHVPIQF